MCHILIFDITQCLAPCLAVLHNASHHVSHASLPRSFCCPVCDKFKESLSSGMHCALLLMFFIISRCFAGMRFTLCQRLYRLWNRIEYLVLWSWLAWDGSSIYIRTGSKVISDQQFQHQTDNTVRMQTDMVEPGFMFSSIAILQLPKLLTPLWSPLLCQRY
jgi:hypothetical protein